MWGEGWNIIPTVRHGLRPNGLLVRKDYLPEKVGSQPV